MKHHLISSQSWKKLLLPALVAGSLLALPVSTRATLPNTTSANLSVIFGSATYNALGSAGTNGGTGNLNFTATTNNTVLGWLAFSDNSATGGELAAGDVLNYILPSSTSAILNQVTGGSATILNGGTITSNGRVVILNPAGITINAGTSISTASFYASAVPETLTYFENNGNLQVFTSTPPATVTSGVINVAGGVQLATIGGTGTVGFAGSTVSIGGAAATVVNGNLYLESQAPAVAGTTLTVSAGAGTLTVGSATAGGNLTIVSNGGGVDLANGSLTTIYGTATISTAGVSLNGTVIDTMAFRASTAGTLSTINAGTTGTVTLGNADFASIGFIGGAVSITDPTSNTIAIGASTIGTSLAVTSSGSISNTGAVISTAGTVGPLSATKAITFSTSGNITFGAITAGTTATITGTGNLSFGNAVTAPTLSISTTGGTYGGAGVITSTTSATLSASGNVALPSVVTPKLSVTSTGGTISQQAATTITANTAATFNAPLINIANTGNDITSAVLLGGANGTALAPNVLDSNATTGSLLTLKTGTNITGPLAVTMDAGGNGGIALGSATAADTLVFGSTLNLTAVGTGAITSPGAANITVAGNVTATTTNEPITIGANSGTNSTVNNSSFGQIFGTSGTANFAINESSTTNLGAITANTLTVVSNGNIVNTGGSSSVVNATTGGVALWAGTTAAPGTIQIGSSSSSATITPTVTLNNASALTLYDKPTAALTVATVASSPVGSEAIWIGNANALTVNGLSDFGTLSFNVTTGAVTVTDPSNLVLTNLVDTAANAAAIGVTATNGTITLGSGIALVGAGAGGTVGFTANGTGGAVVDTANSPVYIVAPVSVSAGTIGINNNTANSLGQVSLTSTGSIAYTEGATVNLGTISATSATAATVSITSQTGSIIQGTGATAISIGAKYTAANFSAPNGGVVLNLAAGNAISGNAVVSITANGAGSAGNSTLINAGNTVLGNVQITGGTFTVNTAATGPFVGGTISQATGTSIFEYGTGTFVTDTGTITLANSGNNFGGLALDSTDIIQTAVGPPPVFTPQGPAGANIKVQESGTNNYVSVTAGTAGSFTAVDQTANIMETGSTGIIAGGGASFTATNGSITLGASGNNFNHVAVLLVTAPGTGNAAITDSNTTGIIFADGTNVGGNLTVTEKSANGTITDSGSLSTVTVGGTLALLAQTAGTSSVTFVGDNSTFGAVEIQAGSNPSSLLDNTNLVLVPGSLVNGALTLTSAGNITTSGTGGSNYNANLELVANGSIVITNPTYITGTLTVDAIAGPTNLSFLSLLSNLSSHNPINLGNTSNYTKPSP